MAISRFSRRNFLATSTVACVGISAGLLSSCSSAQVFRATLDGNKLDVPTTAFVDNKTLVVKNAKLEWDILLIKNPNGYNAVEMKCTHHDNPLVVSSNGLHCNDHGSNFDNTGKVTEGPASRNLKTFRTANTDTIISIFLS